MKNDAALWQRGMEWGKELLAPPPRSHAEAYRHELKYLISYADKAELAVRMAPVLHLDPHAKQGGYFIRSLYFDDYWNTAYAEKDAGVLLRKKYRVRVYNCSDRSIKLERKKKFGSWIYKEAAPLTRAEFERILAGDYDFLLHSPHRLCQEFYTECVSKRRVDLDGLSRLLLLFFRAHILKRPHIVETVRKLDDNDADIFCHGEEHFS